MSKEAIAIKALEVLARLGNGDQYGNSTGNVIAITALFEIAEQSAQREHSCVACEGNPKGNNNPCSVCGTTQPEPPPECQTEAEKKAFAFGWWKALETQRLAQPAQQQEPVAVFDEKFGRPKMLANAPMLTHGQKFYTAPPQRKMPTPREVKDVLRSTGLLTNMQSWEVAKEVMKLLAAHGIEENT